MALEDVVDIADKDGWTVSHLATVRDTKVTYRHCGLLLISDAYLMYLA